MNTTRKPGPLGFDNFQRIDEPQDFAETALELILEEGKNIGIAIFQVKRTGDELHTRIAMQSSDEVIPIHIIAAVRATLDDADHELAARGLEFGRPTQGGEQ